MVQAEAVSRIRHPQGWRIHPYNQLTHGLSFSSGQQTKPRYCGVFFLPMNILLVHQDFPGQFKHLAPVLASDPRHRVVGFTMSTPPGIRGVQMVSYRPARGNAPEVHPWVRDFESKVIRGEVAFKAARNCAMSMALHRMSSTLTRVGANRCF